MAPDRKTYVSTQGRPEKREEGAKKSDELIKELVNMNGRRNVDRIRNELLVERTCV